MISYIASRLRLLLLDVDGVLTDNLNIQGMGTDAKMFHVADKTGIRLCQDRMGLPVAIATGRESSATRLFAEEMDIRHVSISPDGKKLHDVEAMLAGLSLGWHEVAFIGDDLADVPILWRCGLPIAVANAMKGVKEISLHTTTLEGGKGAVREAIDWLMELRGETRNVYHYELDLRQHGGHPADGRVVKGDRIEQREGHGAE